MTPPMPKKPPSPRSWPFIAGATSSETRPEPEPLRPDGRQLVGYVTVESGTLAIVDPYNIDGVQDAYRQMAPLQMAGTAASEFDGAEGWFVISATDHGDGIYPVYVEMVEGYVMKITVECDLSQAGWIGAPWEDLLHEDESQAD